MTRTTHDLPRRCASRELLRDLSRGLFDLDHERVCRLGPTVGHHPSGHAIIARCTAPRAEVAL